MPPVLEHVLHAKAQAILIGTFFLMRARVFTSPKMYTTIVMFVPIVSVDEMCAKTVLTS